MSQALASSRILVRSYPFLVNTLVEQWTIWFLRSLTKATSLLKVRIVNSSDNFQPGNWTNIQSTTFAQLYHQVDLLSTTCPGWPHGQHWAAYFSEFPFNILYVGKIAQGLAWTVEIIFNRPKSLSYAFHLSVHLSNISSFCYLLPSVNSRRTP